MKSLIWKECHENLKWAVLAILLMFGHMALFATYLMDAGILFSVSLLAAVFGTVLGFLQVFFESSGDKRSLLLHRPLSRSRIFLGKALAGMGLYLLALGIPFACAVGLAVTPGHLDQPFVWPMVLPWLADILTGLAWIPTGPFRPNKVWLGGGLLGRPLTPRAASQRPSAAVCRPAKES